MMVTWLTWLKSLKLKLRELKTKMEETKTKDRDGFVEAGKITREKFGFKLQSLMEEPKEALERQIVEVKKTLTEMYGGKLEAVDSKLMAEKGAVTWFPRRRIKVKKRLFSFLGRCSR